MKSYTFENLSDAVSAIVKLERIGKKFTEIKKEDGRYIIEVD